MVEQIRITDIPQAQWLAVRDALTAQGWNLSRGGGLDHV